MSKTPEATGRTPLVLWVDYCPQSPNRTRYQHWTKSRKSVMDAHSEWLVSLRLSESERPRLTKIILHLLTKGYVTRLPEASELTTGTSESNGNMASVKPEERVEPL